MITVARRPGGVRVTGHAGDAPPGQDIVCAAISTLTQTLLQALSALTADKIQSSISPGRVDIKHGNLSADAQLLVDSFFVGCRMVADAYPDCVRVIGQAVDAGKSYGRKTSESFKNSEVKRNEETT